MHLKRFKLKYINKELCLLSNKEGLLVFEQLFVDHIEVNELNIKNLIPDYFNLFLKSFPNIFVKPSTYDIDVVQLFINKWHREQELLFKILNLKPNLYFLNKYYDKKS